MPPSWFSKTALVPNCPLNHVSKLSSSPSTAGWPPGWSRVDHAQPTPAARTLTFVLFRTRSLAIRVRSVAIAPPGTSDHPLVRRDFGPIPHERRERHAGGDVAEGDRLGRTGTLACPSMHIT